MCKGLAMPSEPRGASFPRQNQLSRAGLDLLALRGAEPLNNVVHVPGHELRPFLLSLTVKTSITIIGFGNELSIKLFSLTPDLSPATNRMALRFGSKAKATRHLPSVALNRSSFILAWREPLSVSTRGLPNCGPNCCKNPRQSEDFATHVLVPFVEFRLKLVADFNSPARQTNVSYYVL
jgi:hypothetical protein